MSFSHVTFYSMQIVPALLAYYTGKKGYAIACVFWGLGNIFAFVSSK
jgi:hypothetical protein